MLYLYIYIYYYEIGNVVSLFHPINMATLYVDKSLFDNKEILLDYIKESKYSEDWIVPDDFIYTDSLVRSFLMNSRQGRQKYALLLKRCWKLQKQLRREPVNTQLTMTSLERGSKYIHNYV